MNRQEREQHIKSYAFGYYNPISDIKGFNKVLFQNVGIMTRKQTIARLLNYI